jgi:hypothetical protein
VSGEQDSKEEGSDKFGSGRDGRRVDLVTGYLGQRAECVGGQSLDSDGDLSSAPRHLGTSAIRRLDAVRTLTAVLLGVLGDRRGRIAGIELLTALVCSLLNVDLALKNSQRARHEEGG